MAVAKPSKNSHSGFIYIVPKEIVSLSDPNWIVCEKKFLIQSLRDWGMTINGDETLVRVCVSDKLGADAEDDWNINVPFGPNAVFPVMLPVNEVLGLFDGNQKKFYHTSGMEVSVTANQVGSRIKTQGSFHTYLISLVNEYNIANDLPPIK